MDRRFPESAAAFLDFPRYLRAHGFPVATEQALAFMQAVPLLGPRSMRQLRQAAHATLAPLADRRGEFDELFHRFFWEEGEGIAAARSLPERDAPAAEGLGALQGVAELRQLNESGAAASLNEALGLRSLAIGDENDALRRLRRDAHRELPKRLRLRQQSMPHGAHIDLRRSLPGLVPNDGDLVTLKRMGQKREPRRVVVLIDISGSMKASTEAYLDFAYELTQAARDTETFVFGTRLTRATMALRLRSKPVALARASQAVADWDGGTRIGEALEAFLATSRYASLAQGAVLLIVSDGLERGDHNRMVAAVRRLERRAWRLSWLSPLAGDPRFRPETTAIKALLPIVGRIGDGSSLESLVDHLLSHSQAQKKLSLPGLSRQSIVPFVSASEVRHNGSPGQARG